MLSKPMKSCRGCRTYPNCIKLEFDNPFILLCPCVPCLIKCMCKYACTEYEDITDKFLELQLARRKRQK